MRVFRIAWMCWQLEVLRIRFPDWDIIRTERDVWSVRKPPVNRVIVGEFETVRNELEWFEKLFEDGVVPVHRLRSLGHLAVGARKMEDG
ncbi:hypothetical protein GCM10022254_26540 [Actinomadura meridiana]|uniref:Uncharacterized protein n=1 Tax=Actinomadura meridiana TaxID=559626 RepID=A0ABP8BZ35_9ACTN